MVYPIKKRRLSYLNRRNARGCAVSSRVDSNSMDTPAVSRGWTSPAYVDENVEDNADDETMEDSQQFCNSHADDCDVPRCQQKSVTDDVQTEARGSLEFLAAAAMLNIMRTSSKDVDTTTHDDQAPWNRKNPESSMACETEPPMKRKDVSTDVQEAEAVVSADAKDGCSKKAAAYFSPDAVPSKSCTSQASVPARLGISDEAKEEKNVVSDDNSGSTSSSHEEENESTNDIEMNVEKKRSPYKKRKFTRVNESFGTESVKREELSVSLEPMEEEEEDAGVVGVLPLDLVAEAVEAAVAKTDNFTAKEPSHVRHPPVPAVVVTRSDSDSADSEATDGSSATKFETRKTERNSTTPVSFKDALHHAQAQALQHQALIRLQEQQRRRIKMTRAEAAGPVVARLQDNDEPNSGGALTNGESRTQKASPKGSATVTNPVKSEYEPIAPSLTAVAPPPSTDDTDGDREKEDDAKRFALALEAGTEGIPPPAPFEETTDMQLTNIATPESPDVLLGRGAKVRHHPGNRNFRSLVQSRRALYATSPKQKTQIAVSIVQAIRRTGGRFIQKDETTGLWNEVGDARASEKTAQALREGQPILKRMISEQLRNRGDADEDGGKRSLASTIVASKNKTRDGSSKKVPTVAEAVKVLESNKHMVPAVMAAIAVLQNNDSKNLKLRHTNEVERDFHMQEVHANIVQAAASSVGRKEHPCKHGVNTRSMSPEAESPTPTAEALRRSPSESTSSSNSSSNTPRIGESSFAVGDSSQRRISSIIPCRLNALNDKRKSPKSPVLCNANSKSQACHKVQMTRHADFARSLPQHTIHEYHEMARQMLGHVPPQS